MSEPFSKHEPLHLREVKNKADYINAVVDYYLAHRRQKQSLLIMTPRNSVRKLLNRALQLVTHGKVPVTTLLQKQKGILVYTTTSEAVHCFPDAAASHMKPLMTFESIYEALQATVPRSPHADKGSLQILQGDPVMITSNQRASHAHAGGADRVGFAACNGDTGVAKNLVYHGNGQHQHMARVMLNRGNNNELLIPSDECTLGYVLTIHKAQGSESDQILLPMYDSQSWDATLLYTAVTRARWRVTFIASSLDSIQHIIEQQERPRRWSLLPHLWIHK
jgi:ATP-dependent exoDNAse (exonuclease V) alpha subunit